MWGKHCVEHEAGIIISIEHELSLHTRIVPPSMPTRQQYDFTNCVNVGLKGSNSVTEQQFLRGGDSLGYRELNSAKGKFLYSAVSNR